VIGVGVVVISAAAVVVEDKAIGGGRKLSFAAMLVVQGLVMVKSLAHR
jgi:hypothetical protein